MPQAPLERLDSVRAGGIGEPPAAWPSWQRTSSRQAFGALAQRDVGSRRHGEQDVAQLRALPARETPEVRT